jgi:hypothetical protein
MAGELRQGMYMKLTNGSRDFDDVERNEELLVYYGKNTGGAGLGI